MYDSKISAEDKLLNLKLNIPCGTAPLPNYIYDLEEGSELSLSIPEKQSPPTKKEIKRKSSFYSNKPLNYKATNLKRTPSTTVKGYATKGVEYPLPPTPKLRKPLSVTLDLDTSIKQ